MRMKNVVTITKSIATLFMRYRNWFGVLKDISRNEATCRLHLRNGPLVEGPEDSELLNLVNEIFFKECYCWKDVRVGESDIVMDVGANIGVFTCYAAMKTRNTVYAIEPYDRNVKVLEANIKRNKLGNVRIINVALADKTGIADLYVAETRGGCLLFDHNIRGKLHERVAVSVRSLGQAMDDFEIKRIDFLKIDCEGSEGFIFRSIPTDYLLRIRKIAMEFHDNVSLLKHNDIIAVQNKSKFYDRPLK